MRLHAIDAANLLEKTVSSKGKPNVTDMEKPIDLERLYDAPPQRLWQALTQLDPMRVWYFPMLRSFEPQTGFETRFDVRHDGAIYPHVWKVTRAEKDRTIAYTWHYDGYPGLAEVAFELEPTDNGTKLAFRQTFLESFEPEQHPAFSRANWMAGWMQLFDALEVFLKP